MKSRKRKEKLRKQLRYFLEWGSGKGCIHKKSSEIKLIWDDYIYWVARAIHKELHPKTLDSYYL